MKQLLALAVVALAWQIVSVCAGEQAVASSKEVAAPAPPPTSYFRSNEFSLGVFGSYGVGFYDNHHAIGEHAWGGGVDGQYFPLQLYLGVAIEGDFFTETPQECSCDCSASHFDLRSHTTHCLSIKYLARGL